MSFDMNPLEVDVGRKKKQGGCSLLPYIRLFGGIAYSSK